MVRILLEAALPPGALDRGLEAARDRPYTRELRLSTVVDVLSLTVTKVRPSVHAALRACADRVPTSTQAFYGQRARTETPVSQALVVYQPDIDLRTEVFPYEDAHAQERRILPQRRAAARPGQLLVADRNFCTTATLLNRHDRSAAFLIRRHGRSLCCRERERPRPAGREGGRRLSEPSLEVFEAATGRRLAAKPEG